MPGGSLTWAFLLTPVGAQAGRWGMGLPCTEGMERSPRIIGLPS